MDIIGIYLDESCSELLTMVSVGEYNQIDSYVGSNTTFGTHVIDETTYNFVGLWQYSTSTVRNDDPTVFELPETTADGKYIYLSTKLRFRYKCHAEGTHDYDWNFNGFQYKNSNGQWSNLYSQISYTHTHAYDPIKICVRFGEIESGNIKGDYIGIDAFVRHIGQQDYSIFRCYLGVNHRDVIFNTNDQSFKPTKNSHRGNNGPGFYTGSPVPPMGANQISAVLSAYSSGDGTGLTYYMPDSTFFLDFLAWLYSAGIVKDRERYRDATISAVYVPCKPKAYTANWDRVYCSNNTFSDSGGHCAVVTDPFYLGESEKWYASMQGYNSYADVTDCEFTLYLPFYGRVNIEGAAISGGYLYVRFAIDCRNGNIMYEVITKSREDDAFGEHIYGAYTGNCGVPIPLVGSGVQGTVLGKVTNILGATNTGATKGAKTGAGMGLVGAGTGALVGSAVGAASGLVENLGNYIVDKAGTVDVNCASMGSLSIAVEVKRTIVLSPGTEQGEYPATCGIPSTQLDYVKNFHGHTIFNVVHADDVSGATVEEKAEIEKLLKSGVIV